MVNEEDSDADDEGIIQGEKGEDVERLGLPKEEDFVRKFRDPKLPSEEEVERHFISGHVPYRSWCGVCVRSKGRDMDHVRDGGKERLLPEYSWDYCFPGDELGFKWTVLVGKERGSRSFMASAVPMKGGTGRFAIDKCLEFVEENGDREGNIIVKTDQEPSITYLVKGDCGAETRGEDHR